MRLIEKISQYTGLDMQTERVRLSLTQGIGVHFSGFKAASKDGNISVRASDVTVNIAAKELFRGRISPTRIFLVQPEIGVFLKNNDTNRDIEGLREINRIPFFWTNDLFSLRVEKGQLNIINRDYELPDFSLNILRKNPSTPTLVLNSMGKIRIMGEDIPYTLKGTLTPSPKMDFLASTDLIVETGKAPINLLPTGHAFFFTRGTFMTRLNIKSGPGDIIEANGRISMNSIHYRIISNDQQKDFFFPEFSLDFLSRIDGEKWRFSLITLKSNDISINASLNLDFGNPENLFLGLSIKSEIMPVTVFKDIFPSPLLSSWIEKELFPTLTQGDIKLNLFELNGSIEEIRNLSLPQNHSAIRLDLECKKIVLSKDEFHIPHRDISSQISLENGEFRISDINANIGLSRIRHADFRMKDIFNSKAYEFRIEGIIRLEELLWYKESRYMPEKLHIQLDKIGQISGNLDCDWTMAFEDGWRFPKILKGYFHFTDCHLVQEQFILPLSLKKADVYIDEAALNKFNAKGSFGLSPFSLSGSFEVTDNQIQFHRADISADTEINQLLSLIVDPAKIPLAFEKPLACRIEAVKEPDYYSFAGNVALDGIILEKGKYLITPPGKEDNFIFDIRYRPGELLELRKSIARFGNSLIGISGVHNINSPGDTVINLSAHKISLEDFDIRPKGKSTRFKGSINGDLKINLFSNDSEDLLLTGNLKGENIYIETERLLSPLRECEFQFGLDGKMLKIDLLRMKIGKSDISVNGSLSGWREVKGILTIKSGYIDTLDLATERDIYASDDGVDSEDALPKNFDLMVYMEADKGRWRELIFGPSKTNISLKNGALEVLDSSICLEHGTAEITGFYKTGNTPKISFSGNIRLSDQPVDEILGSLHLPKDKIEGELHISANLSVNGRRKEELLPSLSGDANITMVDGNINDSRVFLKALDFLSLQNIFKGRWPGFKDSGLYFESINADAAILNGVVKSDNFIMKSPVFNAIAYGKADLDKKSVDFTLGIQPHGSIDALVSRIPLLGHIITGEKKSIIAYPFLVKGAISDPEVTFSPLKGLGEGVGGIFERLLMTPSRIINDLRKETPENEDHTIDEKRDKNR
ncbi:MAG: AsmA-like C-terminal region-containing protein [Deltaproteobacteria bacterium]|nr:AsmA-like C-terminal region-containing protein [Deltaproteobacteria bacterium]